MARMRAWLQRRQLLILLAVPALVFIVAIIFLPIFQVRRYSFSSEDQRAKQEDEYRRTVAQIVGGLLVLAGGYFTYKNLRLTQDKQITDRFAKAIEQLGSDKLEIRLGGIYSLERIARESDERDHWTIMEVLTAYVREHARRPEGISDPPLTPPLTDIQAIMTVLSRRRRSHGAGEVQPLDLSSTHLAFARLEGTNLRGANLFGADFRGANLQRVDLKGANLLLADLRGAIVTGADFDGATLNGADLRALPLKSSGALTLNFFDQ